MGPYNEPWHIYAKREVSLDEQIRIKESMIRTEMQVLKRDEEDLAALKEQKRLADLDAENKRLKADLADARSRIEILNGEKARLKAENLDRYYEGYNRGIVDGGYHF